MSVRRSLFVLTLLVVALPFVIFSNANTAARPDQPSLRDLQLYEVRSGSVTLSVSAIGTLEAERTLSQTFLTAGRVARLRIQTNDYVQAGDILVELDNTVQRIGYEQAVRRLEQAELDLQDTLTVDENAILIAEAGVDSAWGAYMSIESAVSDGDIEAARLSYERALQAIDTARRQRDDIGGQFGGESTQYDSADARVGEATFNAEIARLQLESLRTQTQPQLNAAYQRVLQAQAELDRVQAGPAQLEIQTREIAIRQAEEQVERAQLAYDRTILRAPFDGVIAQLNVEVGALVAPGLSVLTLADISPLGLTVLVDEVDIGLISEDLPVRVELDALPGVALPAMVSRIAPVGINQGGIVSYEVDVTLNGDDPRARVGMTAEAVIVVEEVDDVLVVPNLYIRRDRRTGEAFVNVLRSDNRIDEVPVTLGLIGQEDSEISSGLEEGDIIVVSLGGSGIEAFLGD